MTELWIPWAVKRPGPEAKCGYEAFGWGKRGAKRGTVLHSADGYWPGLHSVLDDPTRGSWHVSIGYDRIEQHYALDIHCWHGGDTDDDGAVRANLDLIGIEVLGREGELMTPYQLDQVVMVNRFAAKQFNLFEFKRYPDQARAWTMAEHNEVSNTYTYCPANRWDTTWPEIMRRLNEGTITSELEDDCLMPVPWVRDTVSLKSYYIVGGKKRHVEDAKQEAAFLKAKYIRRPEVMMTPQELAAIPDA